MAGLVVLGVVLLLGLVLFTPLLVRATREEAEITGADTPETAGPMEEDRED